MRKLALVLILALIVSAMGITPLMALAEQDPIEISIMTTEFGISPIGSPVQEQWEQAMRDMLGRDITFHYELVNIGDYGTKCKLMLSTGTLPDILTIGWVDHPELLNYGDQGMFVELTERWDDLPNYRRVYEADGLAASKTQTIDGKLYAFYNAAYYPDGNPALKYGGAVRRDILAELNLEIPTTLDEFYAVAKAIKEAKPDVYPVFQHEEWEQPEFSVLGAHHTDLYQYYDGEQFVFGPVTENYREGLRFMNKLYEEELISPDYFTHTQETGNAILANGNGYMLLNLYNNYLRYNRWNQEYPEQEWVLIPYIAAGEGYAQGDWVFNKGVDYEWNINNAYSRVVNANSKYVDECLKILDYEYSEEMHFLHTWGVEGLTFEYGEDGMPVYTEAYVSGDLNDSGLGSGQCRAGIFPEMQDNSLYVLNQIHMPLPVYDVFSGEVIDRVETVYAMENYDDQYAAPVAPSFTLSTDDSAEYTNIYNLVKTIADEWRVKFIKGDASLDDDWDAYLSEISDMGDVSEMLEYYNKYLDK